MTLIDVAPRTRTAMAGEAKEESIVFGSVAKTASALSERELPAVGQSLKKILEMTENDVTSMNALAKIVLKDPGLTTKVLRLANSSVYLKPGNKNVLTVTRALVLLGVNTLSSLCASAMVLSTDAGDSGSLGRLRDVLAQSLHAATQARALALQLQHSREAAERAFVQALLADIGAVAFWAHPSEKADELEAVLSAGIPEEIAQNRVLGFTLAELGTALRENWGVDYKKDEAVTLAISVAAAAPLGWNGSDMRRVVGAISTLVKKEPAQILRALKDAADAAATTALSQGLIAVADRISPEVVRASQGTDGTPKPGGAPAVLSRTEAALSLVSTLSDMLKLAKSSTNAPQLVQIALEGMLRGANLDRVVFALVNKEGTRVSARMGLGECSDELFSTMQLPVDQEISSILGASSCFLANTVKLQSPLLVGVSGAKEYLVGPLQARGKQIGFFYADNKVTDRPIQSEDLTNFQLIVEQAEALVSQL